MKSVVAFVLAAIGSKTGSQTVGSIVLRLVRDQQQVRRLPAHIRSRQRREEARAGLAQLDDVPFAGHNVVRQELPHPRDQPVPADRSLRPQRRRGDHRRPACIGMGQQRPDQHLRQQLILAGLPAEDDHELPAQLLPDAFGDRPGRLDLVRAQGITGKRLMRERDDIGAEGVDLRGQLIRTRPRHIAPLGY